jgi:hypothetical protein
MKDIPANFPRLKTGKRKEEKSSNSENSLQTKTLPVQQSFDL